MIEFLLRSIFSIIEKLLDLMHDIILNSSLTIAGLLTPIIAIITVSILVSQYYLAKQRWRLDLYNKRFKIYIIVLKHLTLIATSTNLSEYDNFEFIRNAREKEFLFKNDINDFIEEIYSRGNDLILT